MPRRLTTDGMAPIRGSSSIIFLVRRYGWIAYWLVFVVYTLSAARNPGFVRNPESVPYPWRAALLTCVLLGLETAALNATLRPLSATHSWRRVAGASGLALVLALLSLSTAFSDMPGYYYAPGLFALVNVIVVPLAGAVLVFTQRPTMGAGH